jgi:ABC-2 type transport system permease protein
MKRYWNIYKQFLSHTIKRMMAYRLNFFIRSIHPLFYAGMLFGVIMVIFNNTTQLAGWTRDEVLLLFAVFYCMHGIQMFTFMMGIENLMVHRIRHGELDFDLLKPVNTQFLATLQYPWIDAIVFFCLALLLYIRQIIVLHSVITPLNFALFLITFFTSFFVMYFITSTIATISFFVSQAQQVVFFMEKVADYGVYPTTIFPKGIQVMAWAVLPIAFYSFLPTSVLLGRATPMMWLILLAMTPLSFVINQFAWKQALKHYSSASS